MRNRIATLLLPALLLASPALAADTYEVDPGHTAIVWRIKHLGVSYTYGRFNKPTGSFTWDAANPKNCKVELEVKVENIDSDEPKRDAHLKGPDFFNGKMFPTITFKSKSVKKTGDDTYEITGDMSLHGVTKTLTVKATQVGEGKDPWGGYRMGFEINLTIKRSDFKMNFMQGGIGDEVRLIISVEGIKK